MPSRWRWPPENSWAYLRMRVGPQPDALEQRARRRSSVLACRVAMPKFSSGSPTIVPAGRRGFIDEYGSWKIVWMRRRCGHIGAGLEVRDVLAAEHDAARRSARSASAPVLPMVDLPQPDSPTSPSVSPLAIAKLTPSTAFTSPTRRCSSPPWIGKCFTRLSTSRTGRAHAAAPHAVDFPAGDRVASRRHRRAAAARRGSGPSAKPQRAREGAADDRPRQDAAPGPGSPASRGRVPAASASTSSRGIARIRPRV